MLIPSLCLTYRTLAVYKSNLFADIRGSISGCVFSKGKAGSFVKGKRATSFNSTPMRSQVKSQFAYLSSKWKGLQEVEREEWRSMAVKSSGFQLFKQLNGNRLAIGESIVTRPLPRPYEPDYYLEAHAEVDSEGFADIFGFREYVEEQPDYRIILYSTGPMSPGVSNTPEGMYRLAGLDSDTVNPDEAILITSYWEALYGNLENWIGSRISMKCRCVHIASGWSGPMKYSSTIVKLV